MRFALLLLLAAGVAGAADLPQPVKGYLHYSNHTFKSELRTVRSGGVADMSLVDVDSTKQALDRALDATPDEATRKLLAAHFVRWRDCRDQLAFSGSYALSSMAGRDRDYASYEQRLNTCEAALDEKAAEIEAASIAAR